MHAAAWGDHPIAHYGRWLRKNHPEHMHSFAGLLQGAPGGDTGAPETKNNPIPREWYHTDWVADITVDWLSSLGAEEPWFCWMSFPDPHHPWDPPESELGRVPWQDLDLPPGHPGSDDAIRKILATKPPHWLGYWEGTFANMEGGPASFVPSRLTNDQIREVNAKVHVMNELIDEACGRVLATVAARGWLDDTDVVFTTDHGELQGDFGLLYKGPYHTDALMRLPFVWRPAPSAGIPTAVVRDPVGQVDLAPTFCAIAGIEPADWMQGHALPTEDGTAGRERMLCEWDSQFPGYGMHLRSIYRDGWLCTVYEPSTAGQPNGLEETWGEAVLRPCSVIYEQSSTGPGGVGIATGELYNVDEDPYQFENRWNDSSTQSAARRHGRRPLRPPARGGTPPQGDRPGLAHRCARAQWRDARRRWSERLGQLDGGLVGRSTARDAGADAAHHDRAAPGPWAAGRHRARARLRRRGGTARVLHRGVHPRPGRRQCRDRRRRRTRPGGAGRLALSAQVRPGSTASTKRSGASTIG